MSINTNSRSVQDRIDEATDLKAVYEIGFSFRMPYRVSDRLIDVIASIDCERVGGDVEVIAFSVDALELLGCDLSLPEFIKKHKADYEMICALAQHDGLAKAVNVPIEKWRYSGQSEES